MSAQDLKQPAPVDPDATQKHIEWVHATLRENGRCIDGGKCHHRCDPEGECFRQRCCAPLPGSRLTDDWKLPAHQPAPVVDDARMARALEWVRTAARGNVGEGDALRVALIESARKHLPAIEEAIAAYDPNCGARTVRVVDDAMVKRAIVAYHDAGGAQSNTWAMRAALTAAIAHAQGVQS